MNDKDKKQRAREFEAKHVWLRAYDRHSEAAAPVYSYAL